ncbi:nucleolar 58-like [Olea europaea subsp. europaea]|uniref:Nucleolar 58-like n=1 Tax=Olea europaea subsp. europaea TaxID=158383 RepID=A0A8S0Q886_OLEEU|nr:nucleolar 58-like [Olea europaea subsp. europaea]
MDLETENKIAAILLKEAAELRRQAEKEGVHTYIHQPTVRGRPNSRFLTATVRGVQQANRAVEVNEMWRLRQKEKELDSRLRGSRNGSSKRRSGSDVSNTSRSTSREYYDNESHSSASSSSKKRVTRESHPSKDDGLKDDEMEEFLHARIKRGRGDVGSRMDETGPYLPTSPNSKQKQSGCPDEELRKKRILIGPEKPFSLKSDDESSQDKKKKAKMLGSSKRHSKKYTSKEKSKDKKRERREEKKRKHHK